MVSDHGVVPLICVTPAFRPSDTRGGPSVQYKTFVTSQKFLIGKDGHRALRKVG